jgi:lysozyme
MERDRGPGHAATRQAKDKIGPYEQIGRSGVSYFTHGPAASFDDRGSARIIPSGSRRLVEVDMPANVIVDVSHHNGNVNFSKVKAAGILGVIQKATQGQVDVDPTYKSNKAKATAAGLLWGTYHFGTASDGIKQAENFLGVVGDASATLLALDFESNPTGPSMNLIEARAFVTHIKDKTGRFPGFYSGHYIKELLGADSDPVLANCWFWLAQYGPTPVVPPNWKTWTLWQYTDGAFGPDPHTVAGVGRCDRDMFNGTEEQLKTFWTS